MDERNRLNKERETKEDGRYIIYFSFEDEGDRGESAKEGDAD